MHSKEVNYNFKKENTKQSLKTQNKNERTNIDKMEIGRRKYGWGYAGLVCYVYIVHKWRYKGCVGNKNSMEKWVADLFCMG